MSIDVRPLVPGDRSAWDPLWQGYLTFYESRLAPEVTDLTWERFHDPAEPVHALGAWVGDRLVGLSHHLFHRSTWAATSYCYLEDLFTVPEVRGQGVGGALIAATATAARAGGASKLYWQTHATNAPARALYDRLARHEGFLVYEQVLD